LAGTPAAVRGKLLMENPRRPDLVQVGGAAEVLFLPADEEDLADCLRALPPTRR